MKKTVSNKQVSEILNNFKYSLDYESSSGPSTRCTCEGICRCSSIQSVIIKHVPINSIIAQIVSDNKLKCSQIELYCIDRILRAFKIYETSSWDVIFCRGYYGQEIEKITLNNYKEICADINKMLSAKSDRTKIEQTLVSEYGYVLDSLVLVDYVPATIPKAKISFNQVYVKKVDKKDFYSDVHYDSFRAIVIKDHDHYRLVDGYHRVTSSMKKSIKVLVAERE
jgi:hypothetical protein